MSRSRRLATGGAPPVATLEFWTAAVSTGGIRRGKCAKQDRFCDP